MQVKVFHQVLIVGDQVFEREDEKLHQLFNTTHQIGDWEKEKLFSEKPQIIIIANGWSGLLKVDEELKSKIEKLGINLKVVLTPRVVDEYNQKVKKGIRVNALIHTTC